MRDNSTRARLDAAKEAKNALDKANKVFADAVAEAHRDLRMDDVIYPGVSIRRLADALEMSRSEVSRLLGNRG